MTTMLRRYFVAALVAAAALALPITATAQTSVTTTTTSAAVTNTATSVTLASTTNVVAGAELFMDTEAMLVNAVNTTTGVVQVNRGFDGTKSSPHISGSTVYVGPTSGVTGTPFVFADPQIGSCTASAQVYDPTINVQNGRIWSCTNGQWMNVRDAYVFIGPGECNGSVSGNATGTNGLTTLGTAPSIPVVQDDTSVTGTNTHYYTCTIPVPSRTNAVKAAYVVDVQFYYGVQTTGLGTQVAVLASGTLNGKTVFQTIGYPAAAASETPTGLAEAARADSGTLTITPVVASANVATTTAGEFYTMTLAPASPIAISTDRTQYLFTVSLLNTATSATITNTPGFLVHYRTLQAGF